MSVLEDLAGSIRRLAAGLPRPVVEWAYPGWLTVWLLATAYQVWSLGIWTSALNRAINDLETMSEATNREALELRSTSDQIRNQGRETEFLRALSELLPKESGYLRTQQAIARKVQGMRAKVGPKLQKKLHILIDTDANKLYLKQGLQLLWQADVSVGVGGVLRDKKTGRSWEFATPKGEFRILGRLDNPSWIKPDWAYVESGEVPPPPDDPARKVEGELGKYVFNLGDGYLIHGTKHEDKLGKPASHGCVRIGAEALEKLAQTVPIKTPVFIY